MFPYDESSIHIRLALFNSFHYRYPLNALHFFQMFVILRVHLRHDIASFMQRNKITLSLCGRLLRQQLEDVRTSNGEQSTKTTCARKGGKAEQMLRSIVARPQVTSVDDGKVTKGVDERNSNRPLLIGEGDHLASPVEHEGQAGVQTSNEETHHDVFSDGGADKGRDDTCHRGKNEEADVVPSTVEGLVGCPREY